MSDDRYDNLKRKYDELQKENEYLREKIQKLESKQKVTTSLKVKSVQNTQLKQKEECDPNLKSADTPTNNVNCCAGPINKYSPINEKVSLFISLFKGRSDVYAKKWQNKKGFSGYSPHCVNEWTPGICNKPRTKCSNCNQQKYLPYYLKVT